MQTTHWIFWILCTITRGNISWIYCEDFYNYNEGWCKSSSLHVKFSKESTTILQSEFLSKSPTCEMIVKVYNKCMVFPEVWTVRVGVYRVCDMQLDCCHALQRLVSQNLSALLCDLSDYWESPLTNTNVCTQPVLPTCRCMTSACAAWKGTIKSRAMRKKKAAGCLFAKVHENKQHSQVDTCHKQVKYNMYIQTDWKCCVCIS